MDSVAAGPQRQRDAAALIGVGNFDWTTRKIGIDDRIEQHVAIDKTCAYPRDDPIELQLDAQCRRERSPDFDLKARFVRLVAGVRQRVRIGAQRNGAARLHFRQCARGCRCSESRGGRNRAHSTCEPLHFGVPSGLSSRMYLMIAVS